MVWWIWLIIIIYTCIGAWMGGYITNDEEYNVPKGMGITLLFITLWLPVLILGGIISKIIDWLEHRDIDWSRLKTMFNPVNWYNNIKLNIKDKFHKVKKGTKKIIQRKEYDEFEDDEFSEEEQNDRYLRLGFESRTDVWDSELRSAWETDE